MKDRDLVIEPQILAVTLSEIHKVLQSHGIDDEVPSIYCKSKDLFDIGPASPTLILGEQPSSINEELRSLYFGLKNIILLEIQHSAKGQTASDVKQFFGF